jgi:hypothetical protein
VVFYRDPLTSYVRLVAGSFAAGRIPAGAVAVAATTQTAARFGLRPGSRLTVPAPGRQVTVAVTAIVQERAAGSTFGDGQRAASRPAGWWLAGFALAQRWPDRR